MSFPRTVFCDIDGIIVRHIGDMSKQHLVEPELLPGSLEKFKEWEHAGYKIILTTGRKESTRADTIEQLRKAGIFYDDLIMGLPRGPRMVVNDTKPNSAEPMAIAVNVERNKGLKEIDV